MSHARSKLRFRNLAELRAFVAGLDPKGSLTTGNWSSGQILYHLAAAIELTASPTTRRFAPMKRRWFNPARFLILRGIFPKGVSIPKSIEDVVSPPVNAVLAEQAARLLRAIDAFASATCDAPPHPRAGPLNRHEWTRFHLRHCERHLGYLVNGSDKTEPRS